MIAYDICTFVLVTSSCLELVLGRLPPLVLLGISISWAEMWPMVDVQQFLFVNSFSMDALFRFQVFAIATVALSSFRACFFLNFGSPLIFSCRFDGGRR